MFDENAPSANGNFLELNSTALVCLECLFTGEPSINFYTTQVVHKIVYFAVFNICIVHLQCADFRTSIKVTGKNL